MNSVVVNFCIEIIEELVIIVFIILLKIGKCYVDDSFFIFKKYFVLIFYDMFYLIDLKIFFISEIWRFRLLKMMLLL